MSDARTTYFVDGEWRPATGRSFDVISPHTEEAIASVVAASASDVDTAVASARRAFDAWSQTAPAQRIDAVRSMMEIYASRSGEIAAVVSSEMGAPIGFARRAHVGLPIAAVDALCSVAENVEWESRRPGAWGEIVRRREPLGVVAAVVPWNMPQFLIMTKLVPALLAGCAVVIKPATETTLDAFLLAEVIEAAGLPAGVVNVVPGGVDTGAALVSHPDLDKVSFTGSTAAGRAIASACAANLTPVSLELGGKSAAVVLPDADPAAVAAAVATASLCNNGQVCNALTRIVVPDTRQDDVVEALAETMRAMPVGDPSDTATAIGPLVSAAQRERVAGYIEAGIAAGARVAVGGPGTPEGVERGWYVRPTLFADANNDMSIAREEIFGPVLTVIPYGDVDEAVAIANDSDYGLAGSVFTADVERGMDIAARVRTGTFGINQGYSMDPAAPFGGVKASGYGRELGPEGIDGYVSLKSISGA